MNKSMMKNTHTPDVFNIDDLKQWRKLTKKKFTNWVKKWKFLIMKFKKKSNQIDWEKKIKLFSDIWHFRMVVSI